MTNPFPSQTQAQPAPAQPSPEMNAFLAAQQAAQAQQPSALTQAAAPEIAQMQPQGQVPTQGYAAPQQQFAPQHVQQATGYDQAAHQAPAQPLGLRGQPWTPQQHQQNVPQAYAPPAAPPMQQPPAQSQGFPQAPFPGQAQQFPGGGFPGQQAAPQGGGYDPSLFGGPSAGGGSYPKVRDLNGRLCLFRVKNRNQKGTKYKSTEEITNYVANVAVLDGGPLYSSPADDDPTGVPVLVSETVPYVIGDMTIGQAGLKNRLKGDFVRGRIVRMPMGEFEKNLMQQSPGMEPWQALWTWLAQDPRHEGMLKSGTYFWGIVPDDSPQADQLLQQFGQHPVCRELML
jgi:hypothetical protein